MSDRTTFLPDSQNPIAEALANYDQMRDVLAFAEDRLVFRLYETNNGAAKLVARLPPNKIGSNA